MAGIGAAGTYWRHLRLPFQLTLAPLFLWGAFLARTTPDAPLAAAFISLHLFLYPGITAFNSAYDRDTGPVSGMARPPEVPGGLLSFSIWIQVAGAVPAGLVGPAFLAIYLSIALLAAAYSHPATRWKALPWVSAATVALGQGLLGFLAGWCAASGLPPDWHDGRVLLGGAASVLTTLGRYPSTQVFQLEEDASRGDHTLARALGPVRALRFGSICLAAAGVAATWIIARECGPADAMLIAAAYGGIVLHNEMFAGALARNGLTDLEIYRRAMRTAYVSTGGFLAFLLVQAIRVW
jgi:1,4-dihydroxy-2-naphthoate octaprenyltransferase